MTGAERSCDQPEAVTASHDAKSIAESVLLLGTGETPMIGVLARPADPQRTSAVGVVIVVGGPQTRVGSHRQFVVLARALARSGHCCLRFDATGMGDSFGPKPDFEKLGPDIRAACDALLDSVEQCQKVVLWGLCDGATASLIHAAADDRIAGVVAANPWARSDATRSAAIVSDHYVSRLRSTRFWRRLLSGKVAVLASVREAIGHGFAARRAALVTKDDSAPTLPMRLARAVAAPVVPVRLQLSGNDLTASEFEIAMKASGIVDLERASVARFEDADHTFSAGPTWGSAVTDAVAFIQSLEPSEAG